MIGVRDIRERAERWWDDQSLLRAVVRGEEFFPKDIPRIGRVGKDERRQDFPRVRAEQTALLEKSKDRAGSGYRLEWETRNYRDIGENRFISRVYFETLEDYLAFTGKKRVFQDFLADLALIRGERPELEDWLAQNPLQVVAHHGAWPGLLAVCRYFLHEHQRDRYYIRELPVPVHTKFVEDHRAILSSLLDALLPPERIDAQYTGIRGFEQRYGLRYSEPTVRLRLLDPDIARQHLSGLTDVQIPISDFNALRLPLRRLIILENQTNYANLLNFLTLPQLAGGGAVFGRGFALGALRDARWLHDIDLYYWGDLDAHGMQILSQLRSYFPHTKALMMDRETLDAHRAYWTEGPPSAVQQLPHLTAEEQELFTFLNENRIRLEQERVLQAWVVGVMAQWYTDRTDELIGTDLDQ